MSARTITVRGRSFAVQDHDEKCFGSGVERSFWDVFEADGYDPNLLDLIDRLCKLPGVFVDVGAWVGAVSLYAAASGATVVSIEPDPVSFAALTENRRLNPSLSILALCRAVVPVADPHAQVPLVGPLGLGLTLAGEGLAGEAAATAATLPGLLSASDVDLADVRLVKIDIEGGEVSLMPRLGPWLAGHSIPVIVSMHGTDPEPQWFDGFKTVAVGGPYGDVVALPFVTLDSRGLG